MTIAEQYLLSFCAQEDAWDHFEVLLILACIMHWSTII